MPTFPPPCLRWCAIFFGSLLWLAAPVAAADMLGLSHGRLATPAANAARSFEAGGQLSADDYYFGLRGNYRLGERATGFADLGTVTTDYDTSNVAFGIGSYFYWGPANPNLDLSLKGALHHLAGDNSTTILSVDFLFSSADTTELRTQRFQWYGSLGLHRSFNRKSSIVLAASAGLVRPTETGQYFVGINLIEEVFFSAGYRFDLR